MLKLKLIMVMPHSIKLIEIKILSFTIKILWEPHFLLFQQEYQKLFKIKSLKKHLNLEMDLAKLLYCIIPSENKQFESNKIVNYG